MWWAGALIHQPAALHKDRLSFAVQCDVRGKSTSLNEDFVSALLLSSAAQSVDSESCMEALVGN